MKYINKIINDMSYKHVYTRWSPDVSPSYKTKVNAEREYAVSVVINGKSKGITIPPSTKITFSEVTGITI